MTQADHNRHAGQDHQRQVRADSARILQPLADVQADNVQHHRGEKHCHGYPEQKCAVLCERCSVAGGDVCRHGRAGQQQAGKIEDRVDPIGPAGDETVKWSEGIARPRVDAALFRKTGRELINHQGAGNEEEDCRKHPEADG